ncbi:MAG TPA: hypothetical protein VGE93_20025, partial [Bryobacteraceae bacterium]
ISARSAELSSQEAATQSSPREPRSALDTVTINARREREIKSQINKFVSGAIFTYLNDSLERWNRPVCPLVAGLPRERAEFILARVSQIARDSNAPLGPEHCRPNLYVVVTDSPDLLLEKWSKRDRRMFNLCNGMGYVTEFLHSRQPVRVYYNAKFSSEGGGRDASALELDGLNIDFSSGCIASGAAGTRLSYGAVQELTSVIIVVDSRQTTNCNMGQLADYIAMVGLAQIRAQADTGTAPSILLLFRESAPQPRGLSPWDEAFLHSLYATSQSSVLEVAMIKRRMFEQIAGR